MESTDGSIQAIAEEGSASDSAAESLYKQLTADEAFQALRKFFDAADADGSGYLDRAEMANVVTSFYRQENVCRKVEVVQREVDKAIERFDSDGDGNIQFEEFVDMFAYSDSFRFSIPISVRLEVRAKMQEEKVVQLHKEVMEEREQMLDDATRQERLKNAKLHELVGELTSRLDDKVLTVRTLEDDLNDTQESLKATKARLEDALHEVDRLYRVQKEVDAANGVVQRPRSNSNSLSLSPRMLRSPRSTRSNKSINEQLFDDEEELGEVGPAPRTPRQGEIRRKNRAPGPL